MKPVLNTLDVVVADIAASIAFYRHLGLDFQVDPSYAEHAGCDLPNGLHLMLDEEKFTSTARPGWTRAAGSPPIFLAFQFDTPTEVDATYAELVAAGYTGSREPWDAFWGHRYATVLDPDGNGVDLYCPLPGRG
ncbi:Predicted lactoylglutathione lyase [Micromonospora echinaurantiaca]|uniref:Predicted lactoylglutathione lyase n=1 Tax=Micromonospora echinaurantiaca TaxID=47857 RepID=A0A1C5HH01_9ACTN|nr:VOC family protein [Micromonospora echinaurantiaca]SCG45254.1 Predicted lactoylglutathione lyase [Micromonospora echinaurantiaca]